MRKIIHIDMDAFFASVEQHDHPELRGLPVIIGGSPEERGVVSTCSYEARAFGVHSAMPASQARRLCPHGIFLPVNYARYKEVSEEIRGIFKDCTDLVEPVSIDEAYLDVTVNHYNIASATRLAQMIQRQIYERTGLTASAGVSYNKFLAKVASDLRKPAGLSVIPPERAQEFLETLPIAKFHGIGKVTAEKFHSMGIRCGADLKKLDLPLLLSLFGKTGEYYYKIVRGDDDRPVEINGERKSVGKENTFPRDLSNQRRIRLEIRELAAQVASRMQRRHLAGKTVTLKVRYSDFQTITRAKSLRTPVDRAGSIATVALQLLKKTEAGIRPVRLLGVTVSNFCTESDRNAPEQLEFDF